MKTFLAFTGLLLLTACESGERSNAIYEWPVVSNPDAIAVFGSSRSWSDPKVWLTPMSMDWSTEIVEIDPLEVSVTDTFVVLVVQDDDDIWRAILVPYRIPAKIPSEWTSIDTLQPKIKHVVVRLDPAKARKPRFSTQYFSSGGFLEVMGNDGNVNLVGSELQFSELSPGWHSFLLNWTCPGDEYTCTARNWLGFQVTKGHYRLAARRQGDHITFVATDLSSNRVVARSPMMPIEKIKNQDLPLRTE